MLHIFDAVNFNFIVIISNMVNVLRMERQKMMEKSIIDYPKFIILLFYIIANRLAAFPANRWKKEYTKLAVCVLFQSIKVKE